MTKRIEEQNKGTSGEGYDRDEILKELGPLLGETILETGEDRFFSSAKERCRRIFNRYYPDYKNHNYWFTLEMAKYLRPNMLILDAGCGREMEFARKFQVKYGRFIGVNLEIDAKVNSDFCQAVHGNLEGLPFIYYTFSSNII